MFAIMEGRICRVITSADHGPDLVKVDLVTGTRVHRATAGKRPGPGWRPNPNGDRRKWVRFADVVDHGRIVHRDTLRNEYPVGMDDFGADLDELDKALRPIVQRAMAAIGVRARRVCPEVMSSSVHKPLTQAGLPLPSEEEFAEALNRVWTSLLPKSRRRTSDARTSEGRMIIPPRETAPREPEPENVNIPPDGYVMEEGHRWSEPLKMGVPEGKKGDAMELAVENGWPIEMMAGAETNRRGEYGYTLAYMGKKAYDLGKHGAVKGGEPEPEPEPEVIPDEAIEPVEEEPPPPSIGDVKPSIDTPAEEAAEE